MSKQLVTAEVVREYKQQGEVQIAYDPKLCIVTPEARVVAEELGIEIILLSDAKQDMATCSVPNPKVSQAQRVESQAQSRKNIANANSLKADFASQKRPQPAGRALSDRDFKLIREAVLQKMPQGAKISDELLAQLVERAIKEDALSSASQSHTSQPHTADESSQTLKSGIKLVKGNLAKTTLFDGAGPNNRVSIADVITGDDNSSMSAGYMSWEKGAFPWTLNYDEVQVILEGELHITSQGETVIGRPGDIIFVPKSSAIEFKTPTKVRFVYIAWPANWQAQ